MAQWDAAISQPPCFVWKSRAPALFFATVPNMSMDFTKIVLLIWHCSSFPTVYVTCHVLYIVSCSSFYSKTILAGCGRLSPLFAVLLSSRIVPEKSLDRKILRIPFWSWICKEFLFPILVRLNNPSGDGNPGSKQEKGQKRATREWKKCFLFCDFHHTHI